jgi:glycosyltransferase involved in cell wall biosynthesis
VPIIRTPAPFRLLYDLRWMELGRAGGVEQAAYELVSAIAQLDRRNGYHVYAPRSACWEWEFPDRFRVTRHPSESAGPIREVGCDLVHSTCSYIGPDLIDAPGILTIHDLQHLSHPEFFKPEEWEIRERLYRASAQSARHVICSSEFTRREVHERYGVPLERMTTVWVIPSRSAWIAPPAPIRRRLLAAMGIEPPFLLYPAQGWPHKNHARLVEAFARALPRLPAGLKLVFTGRPFAHDHPARTAMADASVKARVVHVGFRSPLEMQALLQECLALVFPSLVEGFGMPVAEAIIAGKPVACSNATSLPEVAGDAAVMFDPLDADGMAERIVEVATEPALRAQLEAAARLRRAAFSARTSAVRTLAVYGKVFADMAA